MSGTLFIPLPGNERLAVAGNERILALAAKVLC